MFKRVLFTALLGACILVTGSNSASAQAIRCVSGLSSQGPDNFLVIRNAPSLHSGWRQDVRLYNGDCVQVLGESTDFYRVRYMNRFEGWSAKLYLRLRP